MPRAAPSLVFALALAALAPTAGAQSLLFHAPQALSRYAAPMSAEDLNATERAAVTPHLHVGGLVVAEYTHALAVAPSSPYVIDNRVTLHADVNVGLFDRLQVGVAMPFVLTQDALPNASARAAGDLRADLRVRVAGLARRGRARLGLAATLILPTGDPASFTGDGGVGVAPRLLFEVNNARDFMLVLNAGAAFRNGWEPRMTARAAVTIPIVPRLLVTLEALFEAPLADPGLRGAAALEALGGLHFVGRNGLALGLAAGPRALAGPGAADVRAVAMAGYAWQPPDAPEGAGDRDADGVLDPDDRCPDEPAGARPDPRRAGCPLADRDHDGFRDEVDRCPDDPPGDDPDPRRMGCPRDDRDDDGVRDPDDACPLDPAGDLPDPAHRGCPLRDGDHDGVADSEDLCPLEAAGRHPDARRRGCPDPDIDGDEIPNERDACPDERGPRTRDPATNGCPRVHVTADHVVITQQPRFAVDRDVILAASVPLLMDVAAALEAHPELTRVEVQGHTDDAGDDAHNLDLSQRRAASIRAWLVGRGVAEDRLVARGYGETVPIADNHSAQGRARNRRVEFLVLARSDAAR